MDFVTFQHGFNPKKGYETKNNWQTFSILSSQIIHSSERITQVDWINITSIYLISVIMSEAYGNLSLLYLLNQIVKPHRRMLVIITGSTPRHSCFFDFLTRLLPSLASMVTFCPDSKHRTSVNPSAAHRLSHVWGDGKKEGKNRCWRLL